MPQGLSSEASDPAAAWFREQGPESGVKFTNRNGEEVDQFTILESLGGGIGMIDFDRDGLLDLFIPGGGEFGGPGRDRIIGRPCGLFRNLGNCRFENVTRAAVFSDSWWYTHGVAVADYDRDGWPDLLLTGYGRQALYRNVSSDTGSRRFADVTSEVGLVDTGWTTGAGFADLDGDGFPDLYVCQYTDWSFANHPRCAGQIPDAPRDICPPHRFKPLVHALYRNDGGKRFLNVSQLHGLKAESYGLGVLLTDYNDDGRPDIFVTNDMTRNMLYLNRGGKLEESAIAAGTALDDAGRATASMGVDAGDYDGTGRPSLLITNFDRELPSLFRNLGKERFYYQTIAAGLARIGRSNVGWGAAFLDANNDGWTDLVMANGHLFRRPAGAAIRQKPLLLLNEPLGDRRVFTSAPRQGGAYFQTPVNARGLACGDLDNDGWPDLVVSHLNSPVALLRNEAAAQCSHRWIGFHLKGKAHRDIVGTTIRVEANGRTITNFVKGGGSYLSAGDPRPRFGLGAAERIQSVTVQWSWGSTERWTDLAPQHYHELVEGSGTRK